MLPGDFPARAAIVATLDAVTRELAPLAASFLRLDADGEVACSVVHGSHLPPATLAREVSGWLVRVRGIESPAPRGSAASETDGEIGARDHARLVIREDGRPVAGVSIWRGLGDPPWTRRQLSRLAALQPLAESAYLAGLRAARRAPDPSAEGLTPRQSEVAALLATGASGAEIARALRITPDTAKSHVRAVLAKLGAASRHEAVVRLALGRASGDRFGP